MAATEDVKLGVVVAGLFDSVIPFWMEVERGIVGLVLLVLKKLMNSDQVQPKQSLTEFERVHWAIVPVFGFL